MTEEQMRIVRSSQRGKLKIFLGAVAGVGKTYKMLSEARRRPHPPRLGLPLPRGRRPVRLPHQRQGPDGHAQVVAHLLLDLRIATPVGSAKPPWISGRSGFSGVKNR